MRTQKPILALTDPEGDTGSKLNGFGIDTIGRLDSKVAIKGLLVRFLDSIRKKAIKPIPIDQLYLNSRESRTAELAGILNEIVR